MSWSIQPGSDRTATAATSARRCSGCRRYCCCGTSDWIWKRSGPSSTPSATQSRRYAAITGGSPENGTAREIERNDAPELAEVQHNTADWSGEDFQSFNEEGLQLERRLLALLRDGVAAHDDAALAVLEDDLALQRKVWTPTKDGYVQLALAITEPSEWRTHLDSLDPRLAEYLRDAMLAYANARMA